MDKAVPLKSKDIRYNGGQRCDMLSGPCSCGAWHDPKMPKKAIKSKEKKVVKPEDVFEELPPKKDYFSKTQKLNEELLQNIKKNLPELEKLLDGVNDHWVYEDGLYRLYHQSYKVFHLNGATIKIVEALKKLAPEGVTDFNSDFEEIYKESTNKVFKQNINKEWLKNTRPIVEAFLHARAFLDNAIRYGKELEHAPDCLPSGWALVLYFYNMR